MMVEPVLKAFFPPPLPQGGTIGVISPSKWAEDSYIEALKTKLEGAGYKVVIHAQNKMRQGWLAGPDEAKVAALMEMFANPAIDAIMCARGGTGALRLLDKLDYDVIRRNPKPFIGFSDMTCLLSAITSQTGMVTFHGPMGWCFTEEQFDPRTLVDFLSVVGEGNAPKKLSFPQAKVVRGGAARGVLQGGNMALLQCITGTKYDFRPKEGILFIEDVEEPLYRLDRMMAHLRMAGRFDNISAVMVGEMVKIEDAFPDPALPPEAWYGKTIEEIMLDHLPPDIPVAFNVPCGHGHYLTTFPVGAEVDVDFSASGVSLGIQAWT